MASAPPEPFPAPAPRAAGDLFGHPRALTFLFATEMWERFSFYGMRALLVLYMVKYLLLPPAADQVSGLAALRQVLEAVFGPLGTQPFASHIYGLYSALVYLTPIFGGLLADRLIGPHRTVIIGAALMAVGHFMMAFEPLFLFALFLLILGNGAFKPNMSAQVGSLYATGDPRRDRAYSIFYVGINLGAFLAPLVCGTLGERYGWHYGFTAAGVGMTLSLCIYLYATPTLPKFDRAARAAQRKIPLTAPERSSVIALMVLALPVCLFWAIYEQQGNTIALFADSLVDRSINLGFWQTEIATTWFQSINPFMIFAFTPFLVAFWARQSARGTEPTSVRKMAFGCALCAASYLLLFAVLYLSGTTQAGLGKVSWLWVVAYFVLLTIGELYLSPIGLSLVSKAAPVSMVSMMMGVWLATTFVGNFIAGWLGSFWSSMEKDRFFLICAGIGTVAAIVIWLLDRPMRAALKE